MDGESLDLPEVEGFRLRVKFFDYGVLSLALTRPFAGEWPELLALGQRYLENEELEQHAETRARTLAERFASCLTAARPKYLAEDYLVIAVSGLAERITADELLTTRGEEIALLVRGERQALSRQERTRCCGIASRIWRTISSCPTWNAAFVYDTELGAQAALEILEFANSQLLEFRYYDELLDNELDRHLRAAADVLAGSIGCSGAVATRAARARARALHRRQRADRRTENALKIVGDVYAARLFALVAARLGPRRAGRRACEEKLKTLDDIYRFAVEQTGDVARPRSSRLTIMLDPHLRAGLC